MADQFDPHEFDPHEFDHVDQAIRRQFGASLPPTDAPTQVLEQLRPPLRRARFRRRAQLIGSTAAACSIVGGMSFLALVAPNDTNVVIADSSTMFEAAATSPDVASSPSTPEVAEPTTVISSPGVASPTAPPKTTIAPTATTTKPSTVTSSAGPTSTTVDRTSTPRNTPPTTVTGPTTPTTARTSSTTASGATSATITSACGTITASSQGASIVLDGTQPSHGFTVHIGNDGPEELEVTMSGSPGSCAIKAKVRDSQIQSEVEFDPAGEDDHGAVDD